MTTIEHKTCYCGKPGSPNWSNNFLGRKGKVAHVQYCSEQHQKEFNSSGAMVELFRDNRFMLKPTTPRLAERPIETSARSFY